MSPRRIFHRLFLLAALAAPFAAAFAQAPGPVPALPDTERRTSYAISGTTCTCAVNFQIYGSNTDVDEWIQIWVNGVRYLSTDPTFGWSLSSLTGSLATIPRPITDAKLTFNSSITGTVQIVGAERPRRSTVFSENAGVTARSLNQSYNEIIAIERELWDKTNDLTGRGLFSQPGNTIGPLPLPAACAGLYLAWDLSGLNPVCQPIIGTGSFVGVGAGLVNNSGTLSIASGIDANILNAQAVSYSIVASDCNKTVYATGGQTTITLPSVSGFAATCSVLIKNGDTANGKILSGFPSDLNTILWPRQSVGVKIVNGSWRSFYDPGQWNVPAGGVTLFASATGSDSNDGLTSGTPVTLAGACRNRRQFNTGRSGGFNINLADGTYTTLDGFDALCSIIGNGGGSSPALTNLIGDCSTPSNVVLLVPSNATGIFTKDAGEVEINCLEIDGAASSTNNIGVQGAQFSIVDILGVTFGGTWGTNSRHYDFSQSASLNLDAGETIAANFVLHWKFASGANLLATSATTCTVTPTFTTLLSLKGATADLTSWSSSGCSGATGTKAVLKAGYAVFNSAPCNTLLFGSVNCQITPGFPDDAADPPTSPTGIAQLTIGTLPTCNSSTQGQLSYVTNGVASPTYRASVSTTGSTLQLVGCDGSGWTYH